MPCCHAVRVSSVAWRSASKPAGDPSTPHTIRSKIIVLGSVECRDRIADRDGEVLRCARIAERAACRREQPLSERDASWAHRTQEVAQHAGETAQLVSVP